MLPYPTFLGYLVCCIFLSLVKAEAKFLTPFCIYTYDMYTPYEK